MANDLAIDEAKSVCMNIVYSGVSVCETGFLAVL